MMINFYVVNSPTPYNIILGRNWHTPKKAIYSSYDLVMKFPTEHGLAEVRGGQQVPKDCMCVALKRQSQDNKAKEEQVTK